ncbi:hypothetical protein SO802_002469, partial [Lithocarpus litseifolius]
QIEEGKQGKDCCFLLLQKILFPFFFGSTLLTGDHGSFNGFLLSFNYSSRTICILLTC